jgi:hypothetical protein
MSKVILSNHALERAKLRKMKLTAIEKLILDPERKIVLGKQKFKFFRNIDNRYYQAVAIYLPKEDKWLVISVWVKGEEDRIPFIWTLMTWPLRLLWWLLKTCWLIIAKIAGKI